VLADTRVGASKGELACDAFARIGSSRFPGLAAMRARRLRDTVWSMETFEALRERVLDRFEALGPIELKGVADPVPLFRAASW
jgi:class 3 adenylate cyclase